MFTGLLSEMTDVPISPHRGIRGRSSGSPAPCTTKTKSPWALRERSLTHIVSPWRPARACFTDSGSPDFQAGFVDGDSFESVLGRTSVHVAPFFTSAEDVHAHSV